MKQKTTAAQPPAAPADIICDKCDICDVVITSVEDLKMHTRLHEQTLQAHERYEKADPTPFTYRYLFE